MFVGSARYRLFNIMSLNRYSNDNGIASIDLHGFDRLLHTQPEGFMSKEGQKLSAMAREMAPRSSIYQRISPMDSSFFLLELQ